MLKNYFLCLLIPLLSLSTYSKKNTSVQFKWNSFQSQSLENDYSIRTCTDLSKHDHVNKLFSSVFVDKKTHSNEATTILNLTDPSLTETYFGANHNLFYQVQPLSKRDSLCSYHTCLVQDN